MFNQPLNFDTSRVTTMEEMFEVHTPPVPCTQTPAEPFPACCMRGPAAAPHRNSPHRMPCLFGYRQGDDDDGSAFNQPLNFDTSRVTNMDEMFEVHMPPVPCCA